MGIRAGGVHEEMVAYYEETTGRSWASRPPVAVRREIRRERVRRENVRVLGEVRHLLTDEEYARVLGGL